MLESDAYEIKGYMYVIMGMVSDDIITKACALVIAFILFAYSANLYFKERKK